MSCVGQRRFSSHDAGGTISRVFPPEVPPIPPAPAEVTTLQGRRVLLVEDSPPDLYIYKTVLARAGADVSAVTNGELAIAATSSGEPFHVIVVDFKLPGVRGTEVAAVIRSRGFSGTIVGLSAFLTDEIVELWLAAGCDAVARKTNDGLEKFIHIVAEACQKRL